MNARWFFPPLLGLAAFAVGWIADDRADAPATVSAAGSPASAVSLVGPQPHGSLLGRDDTPPNKVLAFRQAVLLPAGLSRTCAIADALDAFTPEEFPSVLALAIREPQEIARELVSVIFPRWTRLDPKSAASAARLMTDSYLQSWAISGVTLEWARADAPAATAWMRTLTPDERGGAAFLLTGIDYKDVERDPAATLRAALALPGELLRSRYGAFHGILDGVFSSWASRDPQTAMASASSISDPAIRRQVIENSARGWASHDLPGAVEWLRGLTDEKMRERAEPEILQSLARKDPAAAADFARSLPAGPRRDLALSNVIWGLGERDAKLTASLAAEIPLDVGNDKLFGAYEIWMRADAPAVMRDIFSKLESNPVMETDRKRIEDLMDSLRRMHPEGTAEALARIPDGRENALRDRLLVEAAARLGSKNSPKAQAWAETLPPGTARAAAFQGLTGGWAGSTANAAAEWLQTLPAGPDRNAAITGFVGATFDKDPAGALAWVRSIPEPAARERALDTAWRKWAARTPASAEQWRDTTPDLSPAQRARLK